MAHSVQYGQVSALAGVTGVDAAQEEPLGFGALQGRVWAS